MTRNAKKLKQSEGHRRSPRISALQSCNLRKQRYPSKTKHGMERSSTGNSTEPKTKCKRNRNNLPSEQVKHDSVGNMAVDGNETSIMAEDCATKNGQQSDIPSTSKMPEKKVLQLALDTIQRRDIYELFAEPVDPKEVEDYYEIIEEPMDFGTMRAKLHEGMYKSLGQFERDVFLITKNAMHFNSSGTTYYRQARAIHDLAKNVLQVLESHPTDFEAQFYGSKRKTNKKSSGESSSSTRVPSNRRGVQDDSHDTNRTRPTNKPLYDRRATYKPPISGFSRISPSEHIPELFMAKQQCLGYEQSLMMFAKDLGPVAQRIAREKCLEMQSSSNYIPQTPKTQPPEKTTVILGLAAPNAREQLESHRGVADLKKEKMISIHYDMRNKDKYPSICDEFKFRGHEEVAKNKPSIVLDLNASIVHSSNLDDLYTWNSKNLGTMSGATLDTNLCHGIQSLKSTAFLREPCWVYNHTLRRFQEGGVDFTNYSAPQSQEISCTQTPWSDTSHAKKVDPSNNLLSTNNKYTFDLPYIKTILENMKR